MIIVSRIIHVKVDRRLNVTNKFKYQRRLSSRLPIVMFRGTPCISTSQVCMSMYLLVCMSRCLLVCMSRCLLVCMSMYLLVSVSMYQLVCVSRCLLVCVSRCLLGYFKKGDEILLKKMYTSIFLPNSVSVCNKLA